MSYLASKHKILIFALLISLASCNKQVEHSKLIERSKPAAEKVVPKTFASPSEAGAALLAAAQSGDRGALLAIFGPDGEEVLFTGDAVRDKASLADFVNAYTRMNRWGKIKASGQTLYIGADNYAFPIPLGQNSSGQWYFDTAAGKDEIQARRIGKNELTAIAACEATAGSQKQYFNQTHDGGRVQTRYAQKFVSDPGKTETGYIGLRTTEGRLQATLDEFGDFRESHGCQLRRSAPTFQRLFLSDPHQTTGSFAILAYPAEYRNSGIMTFIIGKDGVVYQKDLGEKTGEVALAMTEFNLADGWSPAVVARRQRIARSAVTKNFVNTFFQLEL